MKLLLFGAQGQIGRALRTRLPALGEVVALDRQEIDIGNPGQLRDTLDTVRPELIVNAAAYTDVDGAETNRETAFRINAAAPEGMAVWAAENGASMVHYSTDYVFDGTGERPWAESDTPNPVNAYGESKLTGDNAVLASGAPCLIMRTSWIYAPQGKNFLLTMLRLAGEREHLRVVSDQIGAPTSADVVADTTAQILTEQKDHLAEIFRKNGGILNVTASGATSWHGFTVAICEIARAKGLTLKVKDIEAIPSSEYPLPAPRPANSRLALGRLKEIFGITPVSWQLALQSSIDQLPE